MANINYQRKGIRITIAMFGPEGAGKHSLLRVLHSLCCSPPEILPGREEGGEVFSFFAPLEPKKLSNVDLLAKFKTARDTRGDGRIWQTALKQADGVIFVADSTPGMMDENVRALETLGQLFPVHSPDTALVFVYSKREVENVTPVDEMNRVLNPAGLPSFPLDSTNLYKSCAEATRLVIKAAFNKFSLQFEAMGGAGHIGELVSVPLSETPSNNTDAAEAITRGTCSGPAVASDVEDLTEPASEVPTQEDITAALNTLGDIGSDSVEQSPPDLQTLTEQLAAAADVSKKVRDLSESITHVAVSARMLNDRLEALEKSACEISGIDFGPEQASGINAALSGWAAAVRSLEQSNTELTTRLEEESSIRKADAQRNAVELDYVKSAADAQAAELESLRTEVGTLKSVDSEKNDVIVKLEAEVTRLSAELETAISEAAKAGERASSLAGELTEKETSLKSAKAALAESNASMEHHEHDNAALKQQLSGMHQQLMFEQTRAAAANEDAQRYASEAKVLKTEIEAVKVSERKAVLDLSTAIDLKDTFSEKVGVLEKLLEKEAEHVTAAEAETKAALAGISEKEEMLRTLEAEASGRRSDSDAAAARIAQLESDIEKQSAVLISAEQRAANAVVMVAEEQARAEALEAEAASLRTSMADMTAKVQAAAALVASFGAAFPAQTQIKPPSFPPRSSHKHSEAPRKVQAPVDGADLQARSVARELVAAFCRDRESSITDAMKNGSFMSLLGSEVHEMQKTYASMAPKPGAYPEEYLKEEFDAALKSLLSAN